MKRLIIVFVLVLTCLMLLASPVMALSITEDSNFGRVTFNIAQGTTVTYSPMQVYMFLWNRNSVPINYTMTSTLTDGVSMGLTQYEGTIQPRQYTYVFLTSITVSEVVDIGTYPISLSALITTPVVAQDGTIKTSAEIVVQKNNTLTVH